MAERARILRIVLKISNLFMQEIRINREKSYKNLKNRK
ncbi:hypothetical protein N476_12695 [Pseudoalteromonas luteoviolacea H33]|uniref:Uncharacterized protein n=2 Tax=Pseudoalteromonas luteoviolacea TaxID=43657 RepID=A0A0F6AEE7_9GAMM|nr:hypothetical protein N479_12230 [Pseudoalteromonas luteoviolacea S4054]KZN51679.1 hypothetical protein N476_12695 [Pseudoalteromonas luteoviolacea H33]KZN73963.1 hypothetical protein N481_11025 [Pseudoalteromonas luteoviolacea S4047-1]KZN79065.1 hypothetical protein N477_06080 [Pseudoalteromonas luteoviolacea H33-S]